MEAFWVRPMSRFPPLKFQFCSAILVVLASSSYAYQHPGDAPDDDNRFALSSLNLHLNDSAIESSIASQGDNAATMKHKLQLAEGFSFSSSYSNRTNNLYDTFGTPEADGYWDLSLRTLRSGAMPAIKIDVSYGGFDTTDYSFDPTYSNFDVADSSSGFGDNDHRSLKVKTNGKLGPFDHGFSYKSVGAEYEALDKKKKVKDKDKGAQETESWVGKSFGDLSISQFLQQSESYSNRRNESLVGTRVEYTWSHWPYIGTSFSQAAGTREKNARPGSDGGFAVGITTISGSLSMSHDIWNAYAYIDRTKVDEAAEQSYGQPNLSSYYVGGSIYPNKTISVTPSLSYTEEDYRDYAAQTHTVSASLDLSYEPPQRAYSFTAYASNDKTQNQDWGMDTNYFYAEAGIKWDLSERGGPVRKFLSFSIAYDRYDDYIYSNANMGGPSVQLSFKSYSLGSILRSNSRPERSHSGFSNGAYSPGF
jgi:hypothetical protein